MSTRFTHGLSLGANLEPTLTRLFLQGVNLNVADYDGRTALHLAACEGHTIICKFLLNIAKVDYTMQDRWGMAALDDARLFHQTSCVAVLVKAASKKSRMGDDRRLASIGERDFCNNGHNGDVAPDEEELDVGPSIPTSEEDEQQSCGIMMMGHSIEVENDEGKHLSMSLDSRVGSEFIFGAEFYFLQSRVYIPGHPSIE
uniref:Uncharacterized protein n=1 Tax=Ditylenchus dipsaci TaxID=166011 RepID=A0A915EQ90_9BILA